MIINTFVDCYEHNHSLFTTLVYHYTGELVYGIYVTLYITLISHHTFEGSVITYTWIII